MRAAEPPRGLGAARRLKDRAPLERAPLAAARRREGSRVSLHPRTWYAEAIAPIRRSGGRVVPARRSGGTRRHRMRGPPSLWRMIPSDARRGSGLPRRSRERPHRGRLNSQLVLAERLDRAAPGGGGARPRSIRGPRSSRGMAVGRFEGLCLPRYGAVSAASGRDRERGTDTELRDRSLSARPRTPSAGRSATSSPPHCPRRRREDGALEKAARGPVASFSLVSVWTGSPGRRPVAARRATRTDGSALGAGAGCGGRTGGRDARDGTRISARPRAAVGVP